MKCPGQILYEAYKFRMVNTYEIEGGMKEWDELDEVGQSVWIGSALRLIRIQEDRWPLWYRIKRVFGLGGLGVREL